MDKDPKYLFYHYDGDHGQMHRDGVYEYYQAQKISESQENEWAKELADELFKKVTRLDYIGLEFHRLIALIKRFRLKRSLISVADVVKGYKQKADSFTILLSSELILDASVCLSNMEALGNSDRMAIVKIVEDFVSDLKSEKKYSIAPVYKNGASLPGTFSDEAIEKRVMKLVQQLNNI